MRAERSFAPAARVSDAPDPSRVLVIGCGALARELVAVIEQAGLANVEIRHADAERLPIDDGSIDAAIINGIFNLNPARADIFRELARVVRPGGAVYCAEVILREPLPPEEAVNLTNWFA